MVASQWACSGARMAAIHRERQRASANTAPAGHELAGSCHRQEPGFQTDRLKWTNSDKTLLYAPHFQRHTVVQRVSSLSLRNAVSNSVLICSLAPIPRSA